MVLCCVQMPSLNERKRGLEEVNREKQIMDITDHTGAGSVSSVGVQGQPADPVSFQQLLGCKEMCMSSNPLLFALGTNQESEPMLCNLHNMPHLLIAGVAGSGKTSCIHSIICSLLYRTSPDQVRLILIDTMNTCLTVYQDVPHLLMPVITKPRIAAGVLDWAVHEMLNRYVKMKERNARNLTDFNALNQGTDKTLPSLVIILDDIAGLMAVCRKEAEDSFRRLGALARNAGIYLVLVTQNISVNVITNTIKANIPSRIAFTVPSEANSYLILDDSGAEKLNGSGEMLYKPINYSHPIKVQGCSVNDADIAEAVAFAKDHWLRRFDSCN